jgi:threonine synthase
MIIESPGALTKSGKILGNKSGTDEAILESQKYLAKTKGIFAAPEGAALAALMELIKHKWVQPDERIVLFNSGSGLKYLDYKS